MLKLSSECTADLRLQGMQVSLVATAGAIDIISIRQVDPNITCGSCSDRNSHCLDQPVQIALDHRGTPACLAQRTHFFAINWLRHVAYWPHHSSTPCLPPMHNGVTLSNLQAAFQSLIDKLEPLFPEIVGMKVSSDGLSSAIHGCELRLVHAAEAVMVRSQPASCVQ